MSQAYFYPIFWGAFWTPPPPSSPTTPASIPTLATGIETFFDYILTSSFMDMLSEYSTSHTAIGHGRRLSSVYISSEPGSMKGSGSVLGITAMQHGTILGIGMDNTLFTRQTLTSPWVPIPNSGSVIGVTVMQDGTILGIGMDNELFARATLTSPWTQVLAGC